MSESGIHTGNELEQAGTTCNGLELSRMSQNQIELLKASTRKSQGSWLQWQLLNAPIYQTRNLRQSHNNTNTQTFQGYGILSEQHKSEINLTLRISRTNVRTNDFCGCKSQCKKIRSERTGGCILQIFIRSTLKT